MGSVVVDHGLYSTGSIVVANGLSCSTACGIFPDQGLNLCRLHWQADSQPLCHQGSPTEHFNEVQFINYFRSEEHTSEPVTSLSRMPSSA